MSIVSPVLESQILETSGGDRFKVVIFNNSHNSQDEVMVVLMVATKCDENEAYIEMWEAEQFGKASVHFAGEPECKAAAVIISSIGLKVEVSPEWE